MHEVFIHPLADVHTTLIGSGTEVWQFSVVLAGARIGRNCNLNCHTFVENGVNIGNNVTLKSGVYLWDGITVADNVFIGPNVTFVNNKYPRSKEYPAQHIGATIQEGVSIGANATIMGGICLERFAMVGAGSVVTTNVLPYHVVWGNPARHRGYVTRTGIVLGLDLTDKNTGEAYRFDDTNGPVLKQ
jgi:UDP-2-acetamido-3-amino-2,3-dideoxy-glucuronate N-acetyltransferase